MIKYFNNKRHTQTKVMSYDQCIFLDLSNINSNINLFLIKDKFLVSLLGGNMVQQGLEIRCFWFQKKTVQLKTALREVYIYVLKGTFFQKTV